jgi:hypothetical protein
VAYRNRITLAISAVFLIAVAGMAVRPAMFQAPGQLGSGGPVRKAPRQAEVAALTIAAGRQAVAMAELEVESSTVVTYPLSGKTAYEVSIKNRTNKNYATIVVDDKGQEQDRDQLIAAEKGAYNAKYGKLDEGLANYLAGNAGDEPIPVEIRLEEPNDESLLPKQPLITGEEWQKMSAKERQDFEDGQDAWMEQRRKLLGARAKRLLDPIIKRLASSGYSCESEEHSPVIHTKLDRNMIKQVQTWPEVERIVLENTRSSPALSISRQTIGANVVEARGISGATQVGQVEVEGEVAGNPYLTGTTQNFTNVCNSPSLHSTEVAGIIESVHSVERGIAPSAGVWAGGSCTGDEQQLKDAVQAGISFGAKALNCSFNVQPDNTITSEYDQFFDKMVWINRTSFVNSAGNAGCGGNNNVQSPAKAYNVTTAGGFYDNGTVDWSDDTIYECESYSGPSSAHGDRDKPDVLAPAKFIPTTITGPPWVNTFPDLGPSGTSFAAPHITGEIALMIDRVRGLKFKPETIRAVIVTGAAHQIFPYDRDKEGAGLISASWADDILTGTMGNWGEFPYSCGVTPNPVLVATLPNLQSGLRTRVAIAWSTWHKYADYTNTPSADLNLVVNDPSGNPANKFGQSFDNTYEWVEFVTAVPGNYSLFIQNRYCSAMNGVVGWAYWQFH